jgi:tRNA(Ile)-lysidine synthase TilS/MesJ
MLSLLDRQGGSHTLLAHPGDTVASALLRNSIPPPSVVTLCGDSEIVADDHVLDPASVYVAKLIEGYDISGIRQLYNSRDSSAAYVHRRLRMARTGAMYMERTRLDLGSAAAHVERIVEDTVHEFGLIKADDVIVLGLSGGVDSGSLLMLLAKWRDTARLTGLNIHAATFKDFDSKWSETFDNAARLAEQCDVQHSVIEPEVAENVFHLNCPIAQILMLLMETDDAHFAMYVDHHTTRRVLEVYADGRGARKVALGLHTTDLLAALLNSYTSGLDIGPIPSRAVGPYTYVFPLAFVAKRELHLYHLSRTGKEAKQTRPNQWEFNPTDRNFFYHLADQLQWQWPGIETWMFTAHNMNSGQASRQFEACHNCGGSTAQQQTVSSVWSGLCDVCEVLDKHGWIKH